MLDLFAVEHITEPGSKLNTVDSDFIEFVVDDNAVFLSLGDKASEVWGLGFDLIKHGAHFGAPFVGSATPHCLKVKRLVFVKRCIVLREEVLFVVIGYVDIDVADVLIGNRYFVWIKLWNPSGHRAFCLPGGEALFEKRVGDNARAAVAHLVDFRIFVLVGDVG